MRIYILLAILSYFSHQLFASGHIAIDISSAKKIFSISELTEVHGNQALIPVDESKLLYLSSLIHQTTNRCGGFFYFENIDEATAFINETKFPENHFTVNGPLEIRNKQFIEKYLEEISVFNIANTITELSKFHNRFYNSPNGVKAMSFIKNTWENLTKNRSDVTTDFVHHQSWLQPSVELKWYAADEKAPWVIIGGHGDSINPGFLGFGAADRRAPGGDDNASGIAVITEVIRLLTLMGENFKPKFNLAFYAYAAEEVGLRGSKEIAQKYKREKIPVLGVLQLDMVLKDGDKKIDIALISDFTSERQTTFLGKLIDTYVKVPWGRSRCGYACSDHASWNAYGFEAGFPFETSQENMNKKIHTAEDTLDLIGGANHAVHFAKLAFAYAFEMGHQ